MIFKEITTISNYPCEKCKTIVELKGVNVSCQQRAWERNGDIVERLFKGSPLQDDGNHPVIFDNLQTNRKS